MYCFVMTNKVKSLAKTTAFYAGVFVLIYTLMGYFRQPTMPTTLPQMATLTGQMVDLNADTPQLVYFWGSWCHICKTTNPKVNELAKTHPVVSVAVSSGDDGELGQYMHQKNYTFNTINDNDSTVFHAWQGQVTPSYVIVKNGQAVQGFVGIQPLWVLRARLWLARWQ